MKIETNDDLYEIIADVDKFNHYIQAVIDRTIEITCRKVLLAVPALVIHHIKNEISYKEIKETFFKDNPELEEHQEILAVKLNELAIKHPEHSVKEIFRLAGIETKKEVRKLLEVRNG